MPEHREEETDSERQVCLLKGSCPVLISLLQVTHAHDENGVLEILVWQLSAAWNWKLRPESGPAGSVAAILA